MREQYLTADDLGAKQTWSGNTTSMTWELEQYDLGAQPVFFWKDARVLCEEGQYHLGTKPP